MKRAATILFILLGVASYLHYIRGWDAERFRRETIGRVRPEPPPLGPIGERGEGTHWETGSPMRKARVDFGAVALGDKIYAIGGVDGYGRSLRDVEVYDTTLDAWYEAPPLPEALHHPAVATDGKIIYVAGGFIGVSSRPVDVFYMFDPAANAWSEGGRLNDFRGGASAAVADGRLYVAGGIVTSGTAKSLEWYDPNTKGWNGLKDMATARSHLTLSGEGRKLYAVGGRKGSVEKSFAAAESYDVVRGNWEALPDLSVARSGHAAAVHGGKLYVFGGEGPDGSIATVEALDLAKRAWETFIPALPSPRHGLAAVPYKNRIYVLGGGRRAGFSVSGLNEILVFGETPKKK